VRANEQALSRLPLAVSKSMATKFNQFTYISKDYGLIVLGLVKKFKF